MAYTPKNEIAKTSRQPLKKFSEFQGSWADYKQYMQENGALSHNFVGSGKNIELRDGYHPNWKAKDFV